jgi:hypothetical protein
MSVVVLRCLLVPEIMYRRAPEVFLHQESWKVAISYHLSYVGPAKNPAKKKIDLFNLVRL